MTVGPLGYWIAERGATVASKPSQEYRGLDREPWLPGQDQDDALRAKGREGTLAARDRYWELEDSGQRYVDLRAAIAICDELNANGLAVEVIAATLVAIPDLSAVPGVELAHFFIDLERWRWLFAFPPAGAEQPLGLDVTRPFPSFHSAIRQPMDIGRERWVEDLNEFGLFASLEQAREVADAANRDDTSWRPFCVVGISLAYGDAAGAPPDPAEHWSA